MFYYENDNALKLTILQYRAKFTNKHFIPLKFNPFKLLQNAMTRDRMVSDWSE